MTDATTGHGANGPAGRETPAGHDRIVTPTPHEASDPETPAPGTRSTTDLDEPEGTGTAEGNRPAEGTSVTERTSPADRMDSTERMSSPERMSATGTKSPAEGMSATGRKSPAGNDLLPHDECDKLELRLRNAVSGFVDSPQQAVEEADHVVEEIAGRFTEALTRRRRALRTSWQDGEADKTAHSDTEQLRLALRDYRELAERLLHS